jgi:hypothetical protein
LPIVYPVPPAQTASVEGQDGSGFATLNIESHIYEYEQLSPSPHRDCVPR